MVEFLSRASSVCVVRIELVDWWLAVGLAQCVTAHCIDRSFRVMGNDACKASDGPVINEHWPVQFVSPTPDLFS